MVTGKSLFEGRFYNQRELILANKVCDLTHVPFTLRNLSPGAMELIVKMLAVN